MLTPVLLACVSGMQPGEPAVTDLVEGRRRMPAEWEEQEAVWLQWPQSWEGARIEPTFTNIVTSIAEFEDVVVVVNSAGLEQDAREALADVDSARLRFKVIPNDSSWMRDDGPRYLENEGELVLQNWAFDGWGGGFGNVPYDKDNAVPDAVAELLDLPLEQVSLVHERGDLEVNGLDTAMVNWSVVGQRNPQLSQDEAVAAFQEALGVSSVIVVEGFDPWDGTRGHIDGMARFVAEDTILVGGDGSELMDSIAEQIAEQRPDLKIQRLEAENAAMLLNVLVGNGFVLVGDSGDAAQNALAQSTLEELFLGRQIRFVNVDALWNNGGGVHCVTNDQPVALVIGRPNPSEAREASSVHEVAGGAATVAQRLQLGHVRLAGRLDVLVATGVEPAARGWVQRRGHVTGQHDAMPLALLHRVRHGDRAHQRLGVGMLGVVADLGIGPDLDDAAQVHHRDAVADVPDSRQVVRDEQVGEPPVASELLQQVQDLRLDADVERRDGLVADDEARLAGQGPRDADALTLPP
ncbi:MAG: agmatine deiminase family protein [Proteobacteria bacterium]|nr:agmatine deiminase family protein [Pseudomonadota bacterium]MCP4915581.1 agmatine deiminase family protein [Pseudomonadota bacterium]